MQVTSEPSHLGLQHPTAIPEDLASLARRFAEDLSAVVIPVGGDKRPLITGWRELRISDCLNPKYLRRFSNEAQAIGVVLGQVSGHLCSIDCDSDQALEQFLNANPRFSESLVTRAARGGNVWIRVRGTYPPLSKLLLDGRAWGEWRAEGGYTIVTGRHPSGVLYRSNGRLPITVGFAEIVWPEGVGIKSDRRKETRGLQGGNSSATLPAVMLRAEGLNSCLPESCDSTPLRNTPDSIGDVGGGRVPRIGGNGISKPAIPDPPSAAVPDSSEVEMTLARLRERSDAETGLRRDNPSMARLYDTLIANRYSPEPHARNDFLVQAVPFLYRAVAPDLIEPLVSHYYRCHRALFRDSLAQHQREARSLFEGVAHSWRAALPKAEGTLYDALPEREKTAYRICRDLAMRSETPGAPGVFFLSCEHLADRLGLHSPQAQRVIHLLVGIGCLEVVKKGMRRESGVSPCATSYRWLLPLPEVVSSP